MKGGNKQKAKGKSRQNVEKSDFSPSDSVESGCGANEARVHMDMEAIQANIIAEIQAGRVDVKKELTENIGQLKSELGDFRGEVSVKLNTIATDLKNITDRVEQAEQRLAEVEEWSTEAKELLIHALEQQDSLQAKLTDLEARSRRNNIRIHGIPEDAEGENIQDFITNFLKTELHLPDTSLGIQRCHRSLGAKPPAGSNPRSILIYFLEYKTKEMILRDAWKKREILYDGKRVFLEQDYPTEIIMKRKAYSAIRKTLKEKALRFQTLHPARLRVHFETGPVVYNSASEATADLIKRGLLPDTTGECPPTDPAPVTRARQPPWETAGAASRRHRDRRLRDIREKLKGFRHNTSTS